MTCVVVTVVLRGCGVLLANERLSCNITFSNQGSSSENIAWASAQIHCQACVREDIVQIPDSHLSSVKSPTSTETAFVPNTGVYHVLLVWSDHKVPRSYVSFKRRPLTFIPS